MGYSYYMRYIVSLLISLFIFSVSLPAAPLYESLWHSLIQSHSTIKKERGNYYRYIHYQSLSESQTFQLVKRLVRNVPLKYMSPNELAVFYLNAYHIRVLDLIIGNDLSLDYDTSITQIYDSNSLSLDDIRLELEKINMLYPLLLSTGDKHGANITAYHSENMSDQFSTQLTIVLNKTIRVDSSLNKVVFHTSYTDKITPTFWKALKPYISLPNYGAYHIYYHTPSPALNVSKN